MATVTTGPYHIQCPLHGNGVANSSNYPIINADFEITFSRDTGSSTVTWQISNNTWSGTSSGNGHYAFQFWAEPTINDQTPPEYGPYIMSKTSTSWTTHWWNEVSLFNPSATFTSTSNVATLKLWVWSECTNASGSCYGHGWRQVYAIDLVIPTYETFYTVSYDANGGSPTPTSQTKSSLSSLTLTNDIPTLPISVTYNNENGSLYQQYTYNRAFIHWACYIAGQYTGNNYSRGGIYSENADCTMVAFWGDASFSVLTQPESYVTITYNYNGGSGGPPSVTLARTKNGWNTDIHGQGTNYTPGTTVTTQSNITVYARYDTATIYANQLPTPTRSGYAFTGWYVDPNLSVKITSSYSVSANATIYAGWVALPVHKFSNGTWQGTGPYVWKFTGSQWEKIAPIYKFNGTNWENLST